MTGRRGFLQGVALAAPSIRALAQVASGTTTAEFGYRPPGISMWDTWHIEDRCLAHMFHLQSGARDSTRTRLERDSLGHAVSRDLLRWEERPPVLPPGPPLDDIQVYTGSVVEQGGVFYQFYTMRSKSDDGAAQRIGLATSKDLDHWERYGGNPVIVPDSRWYVSLDRRQAGQPAVVDCRDLVVIRHPEGKGWLGYYAARTPSAELAEGAVIAVVRSDDLVRWEHLPPAFAPRRFACLEVPDVYFLDGRWYLTSLATHEYGNRGMLSDPYLTHGTVYAVSSRPEGPFRELKGDNVLLGSVDTTTGYSLRTFVFQGERVAFCTLPVPGGAAVVSPPMRLTTDAAGHLRLARSSRTEAWRSRQLADPKQPGPVAALPPCHYRWTMPAGRWRLENGTYVGESNSGWQVAELGFGARHIEMEARVTVRRGAAGGLVWGPPPGARSRHLVFMLDAESRCVRAARGPLFNEPYVRSFPVAAGRSYHVRVTVRAYRFEMFVDDMLVLQFGSNAREVDAPNPQAGVFVDRGQVEIAGLAAWELTPLLA